MWIESNKEKNNPDYDITCNDRGSAFVILFSFILSDAPFKKYISPMPYILICCGKAYALEYGYIFNIPSIINIQFKIVEQFALCKSDNVTRSDNNFSNLFCSHNIRAKCVGLLKNILQSFIVMAKSVHATFFPICLENLRVSWSGNWMSIKTK